MEGSLLLLELLQSGASFSSVLVVVVVVVVLEKRGGKIGLFWWDFGGDFWPLVVLVALRKWSACARGWPCVLWAEQR